MRSYFLLYYLQVAKMNPQVRLAIVKELGLFVMMELAHLQLDLERVPIMAALRNGFVSRISTMQFF